VACRWCAAESLVSLISLSTSLKSENISCIFTLQYGKTYSVAERDNATAITVKHNSFIKLAIFFYGVITIRLDAPSIYYYNINIKYEPVIKT